MASWEPDEIDFEDQYDKADPIDGSRTITPWTITPQTITPRQLPPGQLPP